MFSPNIVLVALFVFRLVLTFWSLAECHVSSFLISITMISTIVSYHKKKLLFFCSFERAILEDMESPALKTVDVVGISKFVFMLMDLVHLGVSRDTLDTNAKHVCG